MILNRVPQIALGLVSIALFFVGQEARAECLPTWDPPELTRFSDLVVVGRLGANSSVHITEVIKGETKERVISIPSLDDFSNADHFLPASQKIRLGHDAILFLSQRTHPPRVVANGVYRTGEVNAKPGVLGYWQPINPGGYVLKSEIQFKNLSAIKTLVQAELKSLPFRQEAAIDKVKAAKSNDQFRQALHDLERITRIGDEGVLKNIAALKLDGTTRRVHNIFYFIQNVKDPTGATLLETLYDKHRDVTILYALGRLGNPESLKYFKSLIEKKQVPKPIFALYGMQELYLSLEASGDQRTCKMIRDSMYHYVDKDLMNLMMSAPQLISVIPDQGSLDRLQRAYEHHAKRRSNAEYEIEMHLKRCKEKILKLK